MSFGPGRGPHDDPDLLLAIALSKSLICDETEPAPSGDEKQLLAADDGDEWEEHANRLASFLRETVGALDSGSVDRLPVALPVLAELMEVCLTSTLSTEQWSFLAEVAEATVAALFRVPNGMHDLHRMSRLFLEVSLRVLEHIAQIDLAVVSPPTAERLRSTSSCHDLTRRLHPRRARVHRWRSCTSCWDAAPQRVRALRS